MRLLRLILVTLLALQAAVLEAHFGDSHIAPMALLGMAGWDFGDATALKLLPNWSLGGTVSTVAGRFGGQALKGTNPGVYVMPSTATTAIMGCAVIYTTASEEFMGLYTAAGVRVGSVQYDASGHIQLLNAAGTVVATGTTIGLAGAYHYIELKIFVNGASGTGEVHVDGVVEIASTVGNFGSTAIGQCLIRSPNNHGTFDDLYVLDTTGTVNNDFLGDVRIATLQPNGDGAHSQWTPTGGGPHYTQVDEVTPPDGDTTYVSDNNPGDIDTYTFSDVDGGAAVHGAQLHMYARKDDANVRQIAAVARQSGTDHVGATKTLASSYAYFSELYDKDPSGAAWTAANLNADEFGVKEIA